MNTKMLLGLGALCLTTPSLAQHETGSGAGIVYLNNVPHLADPWMKAEYIKSTMIMSDKMITLLKSFEALLQLRGIDVADFFANNVFSDLNEYHYATKLPCSAAEDLTTKDGIEYGGDVACTKKSRTFILKDVFEKMPFLDQGLTLLHERLHARFPEAAHDWITEFTTAIKHLVELKAKQVNEGDRSLLTEQQKLEFKNIYRVARQMGFKVFRDVRDVSHCRINDLGGGVLCFENFHGATPEYIKQNKVDEKIEEVVRYFTGSGNVFVGVGSVILVGYEKGYEKWRNVTLQDSIVSNLYYDNEHGRAYGPLGDYPITDSTLIDSTTYLSSIRHSRVSQSLVRKSTVSEQSEIISSTLDASRIKQSKIQDSIFTYMHSSQSSAVKCVWNNQYPNQNRHEKWGNWMNLASCKNTQINPDKKEKFDEVSLQLEPGSSIEDTVFNTKDLGDYTNFQGRIRVTENTHAKGLNLTYSSKVMMGRLKITLDSPQAPLSFNPNRKYVVRNRQFIFNFRKNLFLTNVEDLSSYDESL